MTNSFRRDVSASTRAACEAQTESTCMPAMDAKTGSKLLTLMGRAKAMRRVHTVVGDGIPRRLRAVTGETHSMEVMGVGVRASVVAVKRGNSRGAKGGRKVDVQ